MRTKLINPAVGVLAAFLAVTGFAGDQDPFRDGLPDDLISPWCRVGSPESWEGRPCVVPLLDWSADGTAVSRYQ